MSRRAGGQQGRAAPAIAAALLAANLPAALPAQAPPAPDVPRERTGPEATPPPLPPYANPRALPSPSLPQPIPAQPPASPLPAGATFADVRVNTNDPDAAAVPPPGWRPSPGSMLDLKIVHQPGERLDAAWVRQQFAANDLIGTNTGIDRAVALVQLINRAFLSAGFVNSGVVLPPQPDPASKVLELRLILGALVGRDEDSRAVSVTWSGGSSQGLSADYVRNRMPSAQQRPFSAVHLERDFRLLAEDPAISTVNAEIRPGARPGEADLQLTVLPQDRLDLYLTAANNRSPAVGGERFAIGGSLRNLVASGDVISGEFGITEGLEDATLGYSTPFLTPRTSLTFRGSLNDAAVVDRALVPLDIESRDRAAEIGINHRLIQEPLTPRSATGGWRSAKVASLGLSLAHRRARTFLLGEPFSFSPGSVDGRSEYTALRLAGDYVARNVDQVVAASVIWTIGLDGTRSDVPGIPNPGRYFKVLLAQLNYARRLNRSGLELQARLVAQTTDGPVYSGERFSAGGGTSVRGYRENLLLTDQGILGSVELSQRFSLSRKRAASGFDLGAFSVAAFVDGAKVRNASQPQPGTRSIHSLGASLSWIPSDAILARLTYGIALKDVDIAGDRDIQDDGIHFLVTLYPLRLLR